MLRESRRSIGGDTRRIAAYCFQQGELAFIKFGGKADKIETSASQFLFGLDHFEDGADGELLALLAEPKSFACLRDGIAG